MAAAPTKITIDQEALASMSELGHIAYAGVEKREDGLYANAGRILVAVGVADDVKSAQQNDYKILSTVNFHGMQYRKDIAYQAIEA